MRTCILLNTFRPSPTLLGSICRPLNRAVAVCIPRWRREQQASKFLRILISIGPTETMHCQTWSDKAGNAPPLTDPTNGLTFPNLNAAPFGGQTFQTNLIMPEPCPFLNRKLPKCSIIRPTKTEGIAMGVVTFLTAMGLFIVQSDQFFELLRDLAEDADEARREC